MSISFNEFAGCYYSTVTFFLKRENLGIRDPHLVTPRFSVERIQIKDAFFAGISKKPAAAAENVQRRVHRRKRGGRASRKRETAARLVRAQHNERADGSSLPALRRIQVQSAT